MAPILVTGGTGTLGRAVVRRLVDDGGEVRVLTRRAGGDSDGVHTMVGDLATGRGLADAVDGVRAIVHCATTNGWGDVETTRVLVEAASRDGAPAHLLFVSIVGVDRIGLPYYRAKLAAEGIVAQSQLPWTVLRATQFHDLVATFFDWQRRLPVTVVARNLRFQPIDTRDVARRLTELVAAGPAGRVADLGGPEVLTMRELAVQHRSARATRGPSSRCRSPGRWPGSSPQGTISLPRVASAPRASPTSSHPPRNEPGGVAVRPPDRGRVLDNDFQ